MTARAQVRKLRHWKQRFDRNAEFVFRRRLTWGGRAYEPGAGIPRALRDSPTKLRRFWESGTVELAEFEEPNVATGQVESRIPPDGVTVTKGNGSWFIVHTEEGETKVNGQRALDSFLEQLRVSLAYHSPEDTLIGSSVLEGEYDIGDETIALGEIVGLAFEHSGLTVMEWNASDREEELAQALSWMQDQGEDTPEQSGGDRDIDPDTSEIRTDTPDGGGAETADDAFLN